MNKLILNVLIVFLFCLSSTILLSQENKLKLHSTSLGVGVIASSSESSGGGFNFNLDLATDLNKNLISLYLNAGEELDVFDAKESYTQVNITYGRELMLMNWMGLEGHLGIGYFRYKFKNVTTDFNIAKESTIGFPIRAKIVFYIGKRFGIGINPNINLNSLVTTYSGNIIIQFKF